MKQFGCMTVKNQHRPAGEKLIVVEKDLRESKIDDEVIGSRPGP